MASEKSRDLTPVTSTERDLVSPNIFLRVRLRGRARAYAHAHLHAFERASSSAFMRASLRLRVFFAQRNRVGAAVLIRYI